MQKGAWLIQGYDGLTRVLKRRVSSALSDTEIKALLQHLVASGLSPSDIIAASLRRNMKGYSPLLEVRQELRQRTIYWCGENPHYTASYHTDYEFKDMD